MNQSKRKNKPAEEWGEKENTYIIFVDLKISTIIGYSLKYDTVS